MNPRFNNKTCIVTGAAQGIGQGVALALAAEGGTVVLADRSEFVHETAEAICAQGGRCLTVLADLETFAGAQSVGEHKTSMLQDYERGRAMEIDALVTVVQELGQMVGVATPAVDTVLALVRQVAIARGCYASPG